MAWFIEARSTVHARRMPNDPRTSKEVNALYQQARLGPAPILADALPMELYIENRPRKITNLIDGGVLMASPALSNLIAEFEPETILHPVQLRRSQRGQVIAEYYYINPVDPVDAVVPGAGCRVDCRPTSLGQASFGISRVPDLEFVLRRSEISDRHLWHDVRQVVVGGMFVSDEFLEEAKRRELDDWRVLAPCLEV